MKPPVMYPRSGPEMVTVVLTTKLFPAATWCGALTETLLGGCGAGCGSGSACAAASAGTASSPARSSAPMPHRASMRIKIAPRSGENADQHRSVSPNGRMDGPGGARAPGCENQAAQGSRAEGGPRPVEG